MVTDEELCQQWQDGSEAAMEAIISRHYHGLFAYFYRMTLDPHAADDLAQECTIRFYRQIHTYRYPHPFAPWMFAVARNVFRDWGRQAYRRCVVLSDALDVAGPSTPDYQDSMAIHSELMSALSELDDSHRSALILRYYHDLTVDQIAAIEGVPQGTIKSRLSVGIHRLKSILRAERRA